jgi:hypothetical protein
VRIYVGQPDTDWRHAEVFYEGVPVRNVLIADSDEGWIDLVCMDDAGSVIFIDRENGSAVKTERLHGHITIRIPESNAD